MPLPFLAPVIGLVAAPLSAAGYAIASTISLGTIAGLTALGIYLTPNDPPPEPKKEPPPPSAIPHFKKREELTKLRHKALTEVFTMKNISHETARSSKKIADTTTRLNHASLILKDSGAELAKTLPEVKALSKKIKQHDKKSKKKMAQLRAELHTTDSKLAETQSGVKSIIDTLDNQTKSLTDLGEAIATLTAKTEEQKATIDSQAASIGNLAMQTTRAVRHVRFFESALSAEHRRKSAFTDLRPSSQPTLN